MRYDEDVAAQTRAIIDSVKRQQRTLALAYAEAAEGASEEFLDKARMAAYEARMETITQMGAKLLSDQDQLRARLGEAPEMLRPLLLAQLRVTEASLRKLGRDAQRHATLLVDELDRVGADALAEPDAPGTPALNAPAAGDDDDDLPDTDDDAEVTSVRAHKRKKPSARRG